MQILRKRECAKKAVKLMKNCYQEEKLKKDSEKRPTVIKPKKGGRAKKPSSSSVPRSTINSPKKKQEVLPTTYQLGASKVYVVCSDCHLSIFHTKNNKTCQCNPTNFYGCFWQQPHPEHKSLMETFACYRADNRSDWGRAETVKGKDSAVVLAIQMAGGKMRFDRRKQRIDE